MYLARRGLISLDGTVARPKPSEDMRSYSMALQLFQTCMKLSTQLKARSSKARTGQDEIEDLPVGDLVCKQCS